MSIELQDKEFVALTNDVIQKLLRSGADRNTDRRNRERRREPRWPFESPVQLWVRDKADQEIEIYATCSNMTESGVGVLCESPLDAGVMLPIAIHRPEASYHGHGIVRHCTPSKGEYFIGIELVESHDG